MSASADAEKYPTPEEVREWLKNHVCVPAYPNPGCKGYEGRAGLTGAVGGRTQTATAKETSDG